MLKGTLRQRGQVTAEVAVLFGVVIAAFVAMAIYLQRSGQGYIKSNAESLGTQFSATSPWSETRTSTQSTTEDPVTINTSQTQKIGYSQTMQ
jgi:uncharacterized protein (UPF0333 family)